MDFSKLGAYLLARLSEMSTWLHILQFVTAAGLYTFTDNQTATIAAAGVGLVSVIGMLTKDKGAKV